MSRFGITLERGTSLENKTGNWRNSCPTYVDRIPPCNVACPAGEDIQLWLAYVQEGDYKAAWEVMIANNPFPAIMGRICYHTCEKACNRGQYDEPVHINLIEKFVGDYALEQGFELPSVENNTGKKIAIVGAGPAGLSAAYFLRRQGHAVTLFESKPALGGMMRYGVPSYRLSREILDAEVSRMLHLGIEVKVNTEISDLKALRKEYDAVFVSTGAHLASKIAMDVQNTENFFDAVDLLRQLEMDRTSLPKLGNSLVVYGGGNTAIDVARSALRLGIKDVKIVYRRERETMSAHDSEVADALSEGVQLVELRVIKKIDGKQILLEKVRIDEQDNSAHMTGEHETIHADTVVMAIGQVIDKELMDRSEIKHDQGLVQVDSSMMGSVDGVFFGGDLITYKRNVTVSIGHGKKAARYIDAYLKGEQYIPANKHELASFKRINTAYFDKVKRTTVEFENNMDFSELKFDFSANVAISEAERCFSCGNCFECDNCYGFCPDNAIIKLGKGKRYMINKDFCKGCGICAKECPCGAIKMVSEDK